jgi:adenylate cyclase
VELSPDFFSAYMDLQIAYDRLDEKENSKKILNESLGVFPRYFMQHPDDARAHLYYANTLIRVGKEDEAKKEAAKAVELNPSDPLMQYNVACFYSLLNDKKTAVEAIKNAFKAGYADFEWTKRDSDLDNIRQEPEFIELLKDK